MVFSLILHIRLSTRDESRIAVSGGFITAPFIGIPRSVELGRLRNGPRAEVTRAVGS